MPREEENPKDTRFGKGKRIRNTVTREIKSLTTPKSPNLRTAKRPAEREANQRARSLERTRDHQFREEATSAPQLANEEPPLHLYSPLTSIASEDRRDQEPEEEVNSNQSQSSDDPLQAFFSYRDPSEDSHQSNSQSHSSKSRSSSRDRDPSENLSNRRPKSLSITRENYPPTNYYQNPSQPILSNSTTVNQNHQPELNTMADQDPPIEENQTHHAKMPRPYDRGAPKWKGKSSQVHQFLRSFEVIAQQAGLSDKEMRKQLGRYCHDEVDQKLLEGLPGFKKDWEAYKKDILRVHISQRRSRTTLYCRCPRKDGQ